MPYVTSSPLDINICVQSSVVGWLVQGPPCIGGGGGEIREMLIIILMSSVDTDAHISRCLHQQTAVHRKDKDEIGCVTLNRI